MDPSGRYTTQERIKIVEAYFVVKSVLLTQRQCRKDFGKNNVHDRRTIQRLVAKFRKADAHFPNWVADARKAEIIHRFT